MKRQFKQFLLAVIFLFLPISMLAQNKVTVTGTLTAPDGGIVNGVIIIRSPITFYAADGTIVNAGTVATVDVTSGTFTASLIPTSGSTPTGAFYNVQYQLTNLPYSNAVWIVATTPSSQTLADVQVTTPNSGGQSILPSQMPALSGAVTSSAGSTVTTIASPLTTAIQDKGGQVFNVKAYGAVCDGTTNDTTAFNSALTALVADHGGVIQVPPSTNGCVVSPDWTMPNDGAPGGAAFANQYPIKIEGTVARQSQANGTETNLYDTTSGSIIKFTTAATNADIVTLGQGNLEISGITFLTTTCSPFILTTQTTLRIYDDLFVGSTGAPLACNDAIILGGTSTTAGALSPNLNFGGFGTIIRGNTFKGIRQIVLAQTYADNWFLEKNVYANTAGNSAYCAVQINDPNNLGSLGGYVLNNRFEMTNALCALKVVNGVNPVFAFNDLEDFSGSPATSIVSLTNTPGAQVYGGFSGPPGGVPYVSAGDTVSTRYNFISNDGNAIPIQSSIYSLNAQFLDMHPPNANPSGLGLYDTSGNLWQTNMISPANSRLNFNFTPNAGALVQVAQFQNEASAALLNLGDSTHEGILTAYNPTLCIGGSADHNNCFTSTKFTIDQPAQISKNLLTGVSTNTDLAGKITMSSGSGSYTFSGSYASAPICIVQDDTSFGGILTKTVTTTSLSVTAGTSDVVDYICMGRN